MRARHVPGMRLAPSLLFPSNPFTCVCLQATHTHLPRPDRCSMWAGWRGEKEREGITGEGGNLGRRRQIILVSFLLKYSKISLPLDCGVEPSKSSDSCPAACCRFSLTSAHLGSMRHKASLLGQQGRARFGLFDQLNAAVDGEHFLSLSAGLPGISNNTRTHASRTASTNALAYK